MYRPTSISCSSCILIASILAGCGPAQKTAATHVPSVTVVAIHPSRVPVTLDVPGRTTAYLTAQVRARVDGIVDKRIFAEGTDVKTNQPLYQIDPAPYLADLDAARAALQKAVANQAEATTVLDRYQVLVGSNAVSKQVYDNAVQGKRQADADVAAAKAMVRTATIKLGYTTVTSPITGRSGPSEVTPGGYVQASAATLLTTVQQIDPIYVDLQESSVEGLQLRRLADSGKSGAKVDLLLEDGKPYSLSGTLEFTGSSVDPTTGSVTMRAVFRNPDHILMPGMFVRARVAEGERDGAFLVPAHAVSHDPQGRATVLVVRPGDVLAQRTVQTAGLQNGNWVVTGGLHDGEQVVVAGEKDALPGKRVVTVPAVSDTTGAAATLAAAE